MALTFSQDKEKSAAEQLQELEEKMEEIKIKQMKEKLLVKQNGLVAFS